MPRSAPASIEIPAIDVSSPLHSLGLNDDGTLQVPSGERYDEAAWYDGSPTPGEIGPAVIEGHVTSQGATPSVFFELGALEPGDRVRVTREDGSVAVFEVYAADSFPKDAFPTMAVYGNTDRPELRLITCGGEYDTDARAHVDNVVVFARLVSTA
ncbi:class F sortase [Ornithinicoccus halotolerans]|uniref:class F sortase n=1 Tax=Ornithinicoccus halotolerans TaxID=1748220 RepID=UPI001E4914EB|nr:class F sortase [Ornithinicoccus halotolerans]